MRRTPPFISSLGWPPVKGDLPHYVSVTGAEPSSHAFTLHNYSDPVHLSFLTVPHKVTPLYPAVDCRTEIQPDERSPVTPAHLDLDNAPIIRSQVPRRTRRRICEYMCLFVSRTAWCSAKRVEDVWISPLFWIIEKVILWVEIPVCFPSARPSTQKVPSHRSDFKINSFQFKQGERERKVWERK